MENVKPEFYDPEFYHEYQESDDELVDTVGVDFDDSFDDDPYIDSADTAAEYGDDPFGSDDSSNDSEFLGALAGLAAPFAAPLISKGIGAAINGVSSLLRGGSGSRSSGSLQSRKFVSGGPRVAGNIATAIRSNLLGNIRTQSGKSVAFRLPQNVATKQDVQALKKGIAVNAAAIRANTNGVKANAKSILSTSTRLTSVDRKHTQASATQNRILNTLNQRVSKVKKDLDAAQEQQRMLQMFQFLMPAEIEKITLDGAEYGTVDVDYKTNFLPMMMAMNTGGSGGDMMSNPLFMFAMMEAFKDDN